MINYWAIGIGAVLSMVVGSIWYGPLFGKAWMRIVGATDMDKEKRKEMQKAAGPLYFIQFALTLVQLGVLNYLLGIVNPYLSPFPQPIELFVILWLGLIVPTLAGSSMWNNDAHQVKWSRFLIQSGYQFVMMVIYGVLFMIFTP